MKLETTTKKIVILASGGGSNLIAIHKNIELGLINACIKLIVSNNAYSGAIKYAFKYNLPFFIHNKFRFPDQFVYEESLLKELNKIKPDLIVLAGYMKKIPSKIIDSFNNKIINIHPSLLPKYGGPGYFGIRVHQEVIKMKEKFTGVTVHFVNQVYDDGPIIAQFVLKVNSNESPEELSHRVLIEEHKLYSKVIKAFCENRITWKKGKPKIIEDK